jgi:hypothetical protein
MTLLQLSREIKESLIDGICNIVIWKEKRSWNYDFVWSWEDDIDEEEQQKVKNALEIDEKAIVVNGYQDFLFYNLNYIQYQINKRYVLNEEYILEV